MIVNEKTLVEAIETMEKTVKKCNAVIQGKDDWMDNEKLIMNTVETEILVLRCNKEEQNKVIDPLIKKLNDLKSYETSVSIQKK